MKKLHAFFLLLVCSLSSIAAPPTGRYKTIVDGINAIAAANPKIASVFSIGQNDEGTEIYAIRISGNPTVSDPSKIAHFMVSTHHGNELKAPEFTMAFIKHMIARYNSDEFWKGKLADIEFNIVPVLNISGYNANQRQEYGRDPNRDYPSPCLAQEGGKLKSIATLMQHLTTRVHSGSVTVHGYDGSLTYPWGMYADNYQTQDHNLFQQVFQKAAALNGYRTGTAADVVYPANGCYEDWAYWKYGMWSLLLELESGSESDIRDTVQAISTYYDLIDSSPSTKNQFTAQCTNRSHGVDLRVE